VTAEELRLHRQRLVGIAFFLSAVVLYSYALTGPITVWPLLMCGTACLFRRKFLAIICSWGVWLALFSIFGPSLMWLPSGNSVTWMAAFWLTIALLFLTVQTIRRPPPVPVCWLLLVAFALQYAGTRSIWTSIHRPGLLQFFLLRPGGKFLILYWLVMLLLVSVHTIREFVVSHRHSTGNLSKS